ncbi:glycosyltransferase family 2 protein [Paenibacillus sp. MMS18-CY102]|uniref:glycosyltransferase family 2 protein n=1 Tax=Paenibacillus sp. MMS18-CY102 TaxID=2682849 RepID=UPI001F1D185D|nr:glycosyltransferase family 2 protein [Paenibacillus sp. MMS18-CY102]
MRSTAKPLRRSNRRTRRSAPRQRKPAERLQQRYERGYSAGYDEGQRSGFESFETHFEGTSIIIPTYNKANYLKSCIESIGDHTDLPYEIIVVDNHSTDETSAYLREIGTQVRYRILDSNLGFSGAVNAGLMMAKGTTVLLLNNDTLVTDNWLDNMLACLNSDARIGMVGPVTNYISGDQRVEVPYEEIEDMYEYAKHNNQTDPSKWQRTDRLTGFCLLFRRELLERTGYFDEGYEIGNYEDDDFNIRVRLQGYTLVIARDSFIHHYGSVSMKALGSEFESVNEHNMQFYMEKWGNPFEWVHRVNEQRRIKEEPKDGLVAIPRGESAFYPEGVLVKGVGDIVFWLENGQRRPLEGELALPITRLSQLDIRRYSIGQSIHASELEARLRAAELQRSIFRDGTVVMGESGNIRFLIEGNVKRPIVTAAAAMKWGFDRRKALTLTDSELGELPEGLPIIAPITLRQLL